MYPDSRTISRIWKGSIRRWTILKGIFEAYGADYQVTLGRFMGKQENVYMKFLGMLFQDENLSKLGNALEQGSNRLPSGLLIP